MTERNLEHEFFTKVKGWEPCEEGLFCPDGKGKRYPLTKLPPISTSWDAFHYWVVPELVKKEADPDDDWSWSGYHPWMTLGRHLFEDKTPHRALEWAMEELQS